MADTVRARAKKYARMIVRREFLAAGKHIGRSEALEIERRASKRLNGSLLALARINLAREAARA